MARNPLLLLCASTLSLAVLALDNGHRLPAMAWSSWNHFQGSVSDPLLREVADAMVSSGLRDLGYKWLNLDDGWAVGRMPNGTIIPDPKLFPYGLGNLSAYIRSQGLEMGIYTARGSQTCLGRPGSDGYEQIDADFYAYSGITYLKEDSCGGTTHGTVWEQYARMRDALNATGVPIYFSITEAVTFTDGHPSMHCYGPDNVFTVIPWVQQGLDPTTLANSYLVEYCNNEDTFGYTAGIPHPGGFLSNLDSQALLAYDNLTVPGAFSDNDMLEVCNGGQTVAEYRSQFSTWSILASPLILGNDPRNMDADCLAIITNADVIAVNQDPLVVRGKLVLQWPQATWPNNTGLAAPAVAAPAAPFAVASLGMALCNASDPAQAFTYNASGTGQISTPDGLCLVYGGYAEANTYIGQCVNWTSPGIGSQLWTLTGTTNPAGGSINVVDNAGKVLDVYNCNVSAANSVQVCTQGAADCFAAGGAPAGCGNANQVFRFDPSTANSPIVSSLDNWQYCVQVQPLPPPVVDIQLQMWAKPMADGSVAAVAFNRSPQPLLANFTWQLINLAVPAGASVSVKDLWSKNVTVYPSGVAGFSVTVQPHDVVMVRASAVTGSNTEDDKAASTTTAGTTVHTSGSGY